MRYFFTSDTHFSHENIVKYCKRPFRSVEHMDEVLIKNWNQRVKPDDVVFELGDFNFRNSPGGKKGEGTIIKALSYEKQLNGKIIHIRGNHSCNNGCKTPIERLVIQLGGKRINLVHKPDFADINYDINIVGHVHEKWQIRRFIKGYGFTDCINVGTDVWNFYPVTIEDIMKRYNKWLKNGNKGV